MPVYEYECPKCNHVTEAIRRMADADAAIACESCGGAETARKHSVFAAGVSSAGSAEAYSDVPSCQRCGGAPGSCAM